MVFPWRNDRLPSKHANEIYFSASIGFGTNVFGFSISGTCIICLKSVSVGIIKEDDGVMEVVVDGVISRAEGY